MSNCCIFVQLPVFDRHLTSHYTARGNEAQVASAYLGTVKAVSTVMAIPSCCIMLQMHPIRGHVRGWRSNGNQEACQAIRCSTLSMSTLLVELVHKLPRRCDDLHSAWAVTMTTKRDIVVPDRKLDLLAGHSGHRRVVNLRGDVLLSLFWRPCSVAMHCQHMSNASGVAVDLLLLAVNHKRLVLVVLDIACHSSVSPPVYSYS